MIQENNTNSDICFLVLAQPADGLSALVRDDELDALLGAEQ